MPRTIITDDCLNCHECVEVCLMSCFHNAGNFVVINTSECIDCSLCEEACPTSAIVNDKSNIEAYVTYSTENQTLALNNPKA